jgi:hypothetical protein
MATATKRRSARSIAIDPFDPSTTDAYLSGRLSKLGQLPNTLHPHSQVVVRTEPPELNLFPSHSVRILRTLKKGWTCERFDFF